MSEPRSLLFLLGPASPFWRELAERFEAEGHRCFKINLSLGDTLFWGWAGAIHYRGRLSRWPRFLRDFVRENGITDILYYADRHPYHVVARRVAAQMGIHAIAFENGYLRPDWITLELGGMGAYSYFPNDPGEIRALAEGLPAPDFDLLYSHTFREEMTREMFYHGMTWWWRVLYPFYKIDRYYDAMFDYFVAIPGALRGPARRRAANALVEQLMLGQTPFFVVALQLQGDYQIRANSAYLHLAEMIEEVTRSFAAFAPKDALLVFKQHPHDNNWENWEKIVARAGEAAGIAARTRFMDGGDLGRLLTKAKGCVLVNSTVGLQAIRTLCSTKVLGIAIYDMPGLTHQGPLDSFWSAPEAVDPGLADAFMRLLAASIQIKGSFHNKAGRHAAAEAIVARIAAGSVNAPANALKTPPRLEEARRRGVPIAL